MMARKSPSNGERTIRIGMVRLTDSAPLIIAQEKGFFSAKGLRVALSVEPSWANIADKLTFNHIDGAIILAPLALAIALGLRGVRKPIIVPMGISLNGNSITVSSAIARAMGAQQQLGAQAAGQRFAAWLKSSTTRPRLAVVHTYSMHNLLVRYWLASSGIDPDRDVDIMILPPSEMAQALLDGEIEGFCAGAPWGAVAAASSAGQTIVLSSEIWRDHPEKCFAVGQFAEQEPALLEALLAALLAAARFCDNPENSEEVSVIIGGKDYLNVDPGLIKSSLPKLGESDRLIFTRAGANLPFQHHANWCLSQMVRWNYLKPDVAIAKVIQSIYRPDLLRNLTEHSDIRAPEMFFDDPAL